MTNSIWIGAKYQLPHEGLSSTRSELLRKMLHVMLTSWMHQLSLVMHIAAMLYDALVHLQSRRWIEIQERRHLRMYLLRDLYLRKKLDYFFLKPKTQIKVLK